MVLLTRTARNGFTLIELSIVLVVIGLLVGSVLVGRDLMSAAGLRAQIAQIEKYNAAVHSFQSKYGGLPGDLPDRLASRFAFQTRGSNPGEGDGNSVIEGNCADLSNTNGGAVLGCGETAVFWEDLSTASLIDATIHGWDTNGSNYPSYLHPDGAGVTLSTTPSVREWLPAAKLGTNNFVYVFSTSSTNYFAVSSATKIGWQLESTANPGITVAQAYNIDTKIDDGLPQSGNVMACYVNYNVSGGVAVWAAANRLPGNGNSGCTPTINATPIATTNCFDNSNTSGVQKYSISKNGDLQNCALAFQFQ